MYLTSVVQVSRPWPTWSAFVPVSPAAVLINFYPAWVKAQNSHSPGSTHCAFPWSRRAEKAKRKRVIGDIKNAMNFAYTMTISSRDRLSNGMIVDRSPPMIVVKVFGMNRNKDGLGTWSMRVNSEGYRFNNTRIPRGRPNGNHCERACHKRVGISGGCASVVSPSQTAIYVKYGSRYMKSIFYHAESCYVVKFGLWQFRRAYLTR